MAYFFSVPCNHAVHLSHFFNSTVWSIETWISMIENIFYYDLIIVQSKPKCSSAAVVIVFTRIMYLVCSYSHSINQDKLLSFWYIKTLTDDSILTWCSIQFFRMVLGFINPNANNFLIVSKFHENSNSFMHVALRV